MAQFFDDQTRDIVSKPSFRIFTTLRHNLFAPSDLKNPPSLITSWRAADRKLLQLHSDRLEASARAFGWDSVATLLHEKGVALLGEHIDHVISRTYTAPSDDGPQRLYFRAIRAHVDVSIDAEIDVSLTQMGEDRPLVALESDSFHHCPPPSPPLPPNEMLPQSTPVTPGYCRVAIDTQTTPATLFTTHKTSHRVHYDTARSRANITNCPPLEVEVLLYNPNDEITEASLSTVYFYRGGCWVTPAASCGGNLSVTRRLALEGGFCVEGKILLQDVGSDEVVWLSNAARGFFKGKVVR